MIIYLRKFGTTLTSRQAGREALAAFRSSLEGVGEAEIVEVDFEGVITFSPSWGDEFLTFLRERFGNRLVLLNTENPSVMATLELLEEVSQKRFRVNY